MGEKELIAADENALAEAQSQEDQLYNELEEQPATLEQISKATGVEACTIDWAIDSDGIFVNEDWFVVRSKANANQINCPDNGLWTWIDKRLTTLDETELLKRYQAAIAEAIEQEDQLFYELEELRNISTQLFRTTKKRNG